MSIQVANKQVVLQSAWLLSALQVLLASLFIGICAQIRIPLFFTPIPITGATFGILLTGALCGSKKGMYATLLYLLQGAVGLPVFAVGKGFAYFFGITGGFLIGQVVEAYLAGKLFEVKKELSTHMRTFLCFSITLLQLSMGTLWMAFFVGVVPAIVQGFLPFVFGEFIKSCIVTKIKSKI